MALVAVADAAMLVIYVLLISSQSGPPGTARIVFITLYLGLLILMTSIGVLVSIRSRTAASSLFLASGVGNVALGAIAIFSIGLPLLAAGLWLISKLDLPGYARSGRLLIMLAPAAMMVVLLIAGIKLTS